MLPKAKRLLIGKLDARSVGRVRLLLNREGKRLGGPSSVRFLLNQEGSKAFVDIPSMTDVIHLYETLGIVYSVEDAIVPNAVGTKTGKVKMKLMAQERVFKKASDPLTDTLFDFRMEFPDQRGGFGRVPGPPGLHPLCFPKTSSSATQRSFCACLSERRRDRMARESLKTSMVSRRPS